MGNETTDRECQECGDPIGEGRLKALPKTKICISCATDKEMTGQFKKHTMDIQSEVSGSGEHEGEKYTLIKGDES